MNKTEIEELVRDIRKKYKTANPYELAERLGINLAYYPLGNINGYIHHKRRITYIVLNTDISNEQQKFTLAHEIGHYLMHQKTNQLYLLSNPLNKVTKYEREANTFAIALLLPHDYQTYETINTVHDVACSYGIPLSVAQDVIK